MQVLKFGGTSVASAENIRKVISIIRSKNHGDQLIVVVSALGGVTDRLLQCASSASAADDSYKASLEEIRVLHVDVVKELLPVNNQSATLSLVIQQFNELEDICKGIFLLGDLTGRIRDRVLGYGEILSSSILSACLDSEGLANQWTDARTLIKTDSNHTKAGVNFEKTTANLKDFFSTHRSNLFIVPGFVGSNEAGDTTTLGRGGSDYTAAILGSILDAASVEIWTDVSGMMTADPRLVGNAKPIERISYHEAMELSHFGAKVIYPPTLQPLMNRAIPVWIKNTFEPAHLGTLIHNETGGNGDPITGLTSINKIALLGLEGSGMIGIPGFSMRLFETLSVNQVNVILITQASSEHSICVAVDEHLSGSAKKMLDATFRYEIEKSVVNPVTVEKDLSIVALVGDKMKSHAGISGRMFNTLGKNGVNVRAIAQGSSERNISAVIATKDCKKAINALHEEFFETTYKQVNVFIAGTGNVGGKLLAQLSGQQNYLLNKLGLQLRVIGITNSRKMIFKDGGISLNNWKRLLEDGEEANLGKFVETMQKKNLRNTVFVDITANDSVASIYQKIFAKSISIVACNKVACSSPYQNYLDLKEMSKDHNVSFLFETNVGASLPIIGTINDLLRSGDTVNKMEAVLSGTLNFVFNNYDGSRSFAEVVRQAQNEGYTEPDPRLDLSGVDVMRKIMILAREAGAAMEMDDITNQPFMPDSCMRGDIDNFYREMQKHEPHFKKMYEEAASTGKKLKFVASYENGKASVGLQHIDASHDFYHLYGKDNIVLFYTDRYTQQPMVIKGAGAGADVTASGVFADIIRTIKS